MNPTVPQPIPVSSYLQTDEAQQAAPVAQPTQPAQPTAHPNFFERLLPTAGGILGGIVGTGLGPLGSIGGSAAGGALGQELENAITGTKGSTTSAAEENALGGALGGIAGKVLGNVAGKVGGAAAKSASRLFSAQGPGVGEDLSNYVTQKLGINNLNQAAELGKVISGNPDQTINPGRGLVSNFISSAAQDDKKPVDLSSLTPATPGTSQAALRSQAQAATRNIAGQNPLITEKLISDNGLKQDDADALRKQVLGVLGRTGNAGSASKADILGMQKQISSMADQASKTAARSGASADVAKSRVLSGIDQQLRSALGFDTMKVDPADAKSLAEGIVTNAPSESKGAAQLIAKDIMDQSSSDQGLSVADLRNMESNWVQLQNASKDAARAADKNFGTSTTAMARSTLPTALAVGGAGGPHAILGSIAGMAANHPGADATLSNVLSRVANTAQGKTIQKILPLATRASGVAALNTPNIAGATPASTSIPTAAQSGNINTGTNSDMDALQQVYQLALAGAGVTPESASLLGTLTQPMQRQELAGSVAGGLLPSYGAAGGAQGLGGGLLSQISALFPGTAANAYQRQAAATAGTLSQLLGISPAAASQLTPQLMQSPTSAAVPVSNVNSILGTIGAY